MKKITAMLLVVVCALSLLVGCSSGKKVTAKVIDIELTQEEYAFGVDKNQPELLTQVNQIIATIMADGRFDAICDKYFGDGTPTAVVSAKKDAAKDQLVVATNAEFAPFEYMDEGGFYGIDMELAKLIADELNLELVIDNMDFDAVCLSVSQGKCDIAMAGLTISNDRKELVDFTTSYYNAAQVLVVPSTCTIFDACTTAADIEAILNTQKNAKTGVQTGTTSELYVNGDEDWGFDGFEGALTSVGYKSSALAIQAMLNGSISFCVVDKAPAISITAAINEVQ